MKLRVRVRIWVRVRVRVRIRVRALALTLNLTLSLSLSLTFREGVACAVGARRGEAPVWRPATLEEARRDPGLRAAMDAAGLSDWS